MATPTLEERIERELAAAVAAGELRAAESWGRSMPEPAGWHETPQALRLPFKILKNAGYAPPELALFHERSRLRAALAAVRDDADRRAPLQRALSELEQALALRLEALRRHAMA